MFNEVAPLNQEVEKIPLDRESFRQLIGHLGERYAVTQDQMANHFQINRIRFQDLLRSKNIKNIQRGEVERIFNNAKDLAHVPERPRKKMAKIQKKDMVQVDKANLKQYIDFLKVHFSRLTTKEIGRLTGIKSFRLMDILHKPSLECLNMRNEEIEALMRLYIDLQYNDLSYHGSEKGPRSKKVEKIPLDNTNFRQLINMLQSKLPKLTQGGIAEAASMAQTRLSTLLNGKHTHIRTSEVRTLFKAAEGLLSGELTYSEATPGRAKETMSLDRENFRQLIDLIHQEFPGITNARIAKLARIKTGSLNALLDENKFIKPKVASALFDVYWRLQEGRYTYQVSQKSIGHHGKKIRVDKPSLRQFMDFLQNQFPGLSIKSIADLAKINDDRLKHVLNLKAAYNFLRPEEIEALFQVYTDLRLGNLS